MIDKIFSVILMNPADNCLHLKSSCRQLRTNHHTFGTPVTIHDKNRISVIKYIIQYNQSKNINVIW